jgi:hypothetical protein
VLLLGLEPGIALSIAEYPMKQSIIPVIVHIQGGRNGEEEERGAIINECPGSRGPWR